MEWPSGGALSPRAQQFRDVLRLVEYEHRRQLQALDVKRQSPVSVYSDRQSSKQVLQSAVSLDDIPGEVCGLETNQLDIEAIRKGVKKVSTATVKDTPSPTSTMKGAQNSSDDNLVDQKPHVGLGLPTCTQNIVRSPYIQIYSCKRARKQINLRQHETSHSSEDAQGDGESLFIASLNGLNIDVTDRNEPSDSIRSTENNLSRKIDVSTSLRKRRQMAMNNLIGRFHSLDTTDASGSPLPTTPSPLMDTTKSKFRFMSADAVGPFDLHSTWTENVEEKAHRHQSLKSNSYDLSEYIDVIQKKEDRNYVVSYNRLLGPFIMSPYSWTRRVFSVVFIVVILKDVAFIPLSVFDLPKSKYSLAADWVESVMWTLVIPCSFLTGYTRVTGEQQVEPASVAEEYLKSWFLFDFISAALNWTQAFLSNESDPFEQGLEGRWLKFLWRFEMLVMIPRLLRIFRIPYLFTSAHIVCRSPRHTLWLGVIKTSGVFFFLIHYIACSWYAIGYYSSGSTWLEDETMLASNKYVLDDSLFARYAIPLHWSITQFIGNIEIIPKSLLERYFSACCLLFTYLYSAVFVSRLASMMMHLHMLTGAADLQVSALRQFLHHKKVSDKLSGRVIAGAEYALEQQQSNISEGDVTLLALISDPLLVEVHYEIHAKALRTRPFFQYLVKLDSTSVRRMCHVAVQPIDLAPGDVLFQMGEKPSNPMTFFLTDGSMLYLKLGMKQSIFPGRCACERAIWVACQHFGTLVAATNCSLVCLNALEVKKTLTTMQALRYAQDYAHAYLQHLNDALQIAPESIDDLSDGGFDSEEVAREIAGKMERRRQFTSRTGRPGSSPVEPTSTE